MLLKPLPLDPQPLLEFLVSDVESLKDLDTRSDIRNGSSGLIVHVNRDAAAIERHQVSAGDEAIAVGAQRPSNFRKALAQARRALFFSWVLQSLS